LALLGCANSTSEGPTPEPEPLQLGYFEDMTAGSGIDFRYRNGQEAEHYAILESLGGGAALLDYDEDGRLDVFVTGGGYFGGPDKHDIKGHPCRLYRNLGNWKFEDVTARVGLDRPAFYTHGCAVADYDNDGWPDLLVTGWGGVALYHNEPDGKGGRRFVDVTHRAGLTDRRWSTSAAWGDLDGDSRADLYVCHYVDWSFANHPRCMDYRDQKLPDVCPPKQFKALPHTLYHNNGDGTFRDVSNEAGLRMPRKGKDYERLTHLNALALETLRRAEQNQDYGKGLGVLVFDADDDGRPDIYVANDTSGNFLYLNQGGGRFREEALFRGCAYDDNGSPNGSMGVDAADFAGVGSLSVFVANYQNEAHALYRNQGGGRFVYASRLAGISALGLVYVGFGAGFLDFDLDGNEDLFLSNGHVVHRPPLPAEVKQRPVLLRNLYRPGAKPFEVRFADVSAQAGPFFQARYLGRGAAFGDLDNDGRTDIVLTPSNETVTLLRNRHETGHHWLGLRLVGRPYRDAVGARLTLEVGGRQLLRAVKGGGSYLSSADRRVLFGLGPEEKIGRLTVRWPSGKTQTWDHLPVDHYWKLEEGQSQAWELAGEK
jgi:hypothetical protein